MEGGAGLWDGRGGWVEIEAKQECTPWNASHSGACPPNARHNLPPPPRLKSPEQKQIHGQNLLWIHTDILQISCAGEISSRTKPPTTHAIQQRRYVMACDTLSDVRGTISRRGFRPRFLLHGDVRSYGLVLAAGRSFHRRQIPDDWRDERLLDALLRRTNLN